MTGSISTKTSKDGPADQTKALLPKQSHQPALSGQRPMTDILALQRDTGNQAVSQLLQNGQVDSPYSPDRNDRLAFLQQLRENYFKDEHSRAVRLIQANKGSGMPLPTNVHHAMRGHFNHNFGEIRIHTGSFAAQAADALAATAFTVQNNVFFGGGMYSPGRPEGLLLLAHELAHTLQQRQGTTSPMPNVRGIERQADQAAIMGQGAALSQVGPMILREPTFPRRTTGNRLLREAERVLTITRDISSADEMVRLWSRVGTNFPGSDTVGSLARRVWTHIFLRHFVEPEARPGVESAHPRYFYSPVYGWIDAQHFFGFIDFAEQQNRRTSGDRQRAFDAATEQGLDIERDQQRVRDYVILGRPAATGAARLMQVRPPNTFLFRTPQRVAGGAAHLAASAYASLSLSGTQGELFSLLSGRRRTKFFTDSAKSAYTYEDIPSNQLGVRFFFEHGLRINGLAPAARGPAFINALYTFFSSINVENNSREVDRLAIEGGLPGVERFLAPRATEETVRRRHPDLFQLPP